MVCNFHHRWSAVHSSTASTFFLKSDPTPNPDKMAISDHKTPKKFCLHFWASLAFLWSSCPPKRAKTALNRAFGVEFGLIVELPRKPSNVRLVGRFLCFLSVISKIRFSWWQKRHQIKNGHLFCSGGGMGSGPLWHQKILPVPLHWQRDWKGLELFSIQGGQRLRQTTILLNTSKIYIFPSKIIFIMIFDQRQLPALSSIKPQPKWFKMAGKWRPKWLENYRKCINGNKY